jgi:hypothetical protein
MPCVPVRLIDINGHPMPATTHGLVDSGADSSILPKNWATILGIDLNNDCERTVGATAGGDGDQWVYEPGLDAIVVDKKIRITAVFTRTPIVLLGRDDFFREFKVAFDHRALAFHVEPYEAT